MAVGGERNRILVVEDDGDVREALVQLLEFEGYRVTSATNGRDAIDQLRAGAAPNLILLDLMMPVMDGPQFRAAQLGDPGLAAIPVIVLSAHSAGREKAAQLGAPAMQRPALAR